MVIWLVGMYASGKSTLAAEIRVALEQRDSNSVLILNGGDIRQILGNDLSYSVEGRMKNAARVSQICKYLSDQGVVVICGMLSVFEESREWNRKHIENYYEIFIDVSIKKLLERDTKNLYRRALSGTMEDFVGVDIEFVKPQKPDLILNNNENLKDLSGLAQKVVNIIKA